MGKSILLLSFMSIAILCFLGIAATSHPLMLLAATSVNFTILRIIMLATLAILILTHPPRNIALRFLVGGLVIAFPIWAALGFYNYAVPLLDLFSILLFSVSSGVAVLESKLVFNTETTNEDRIRLAREARMSLLPAQFKVRSH